MSAGPNLLIFHPSFVYGQLPLLSDKEKISIQINTKYSNPAEHLKQMVSLFSVMVSIYQLTLLMASCSELIGTKDLILRVGG